MLTLGIETSCDETSVAVVKDGRNVLSCEVASSLKLHSKYGGIIPEIASRMQLESIVPVAESALQAAGKNLKDIGLIGVTYAPGLLGSLLVGTSFAKSLALSLNKPLVGVDHCLSHIYASQFSPQPLKLPFVALVVSGGHTSLFYVRAFNRIELLGSTHDDACGEAFDKVAKLLGLGYPGGPLIEKLAEKGDARKIKFSCSGTKNPLDFSFSGIKTAVMYYLRQHKGKKQDIAASFQEAALNVLVEKSLLACRIKKAPRLTVGGGVAMNNRLRQKLAGAAAKARVQCVFAPKEYCLDNAAMVAGLAYQLHKKGA